MISTIITAGGNSTRFDGENKLLIKINGQPVIYRCVKIFDSLDFTDEIIICANKDYMEIYKNLFKNMKKVRVIQGGETRQESVYKGLKECKDCEYVIIHDGARPFIKPETIIKCLEKAKKYSGAIVAVKTIDTVKIVTYDGKIMSTPNRNTLWNAQTPQIFEYKKIMELHEKYKGQNFTDDSLLFENAGYTVYVQEGEYSNFKITTKEDLKNFSEECK